MKEAFDDARMLTTSKRRSGLSKLRDSTLQTIERINFIVERYRALGINLTVRQMFYQFVRRNWLPNHQNAYKHLGECLSTGRIRGMIDWAIFEDHVRYLQHFGDENSPMGPAHFMRGVHSSYVEEIWRNQDYYIEFMLEKDALVGVVERACRKWRLPFIACRGYISNTALYDSGKRLARYRDTGRQIVVFHLGDHDPSGQDMTRDNEARLAMYLRDDDFQFTRLALNMDQIKEFNPPPNTAKVTDSRYEGYVAKFDGTDCWEVDALEPEQVDDIIDAAVEPLCDMEKFDAAIKSETAHRDRIYDVGSNFGIAELLLKQDRERDIGDYIW